MKCLICKTDSRGLPLYRINKKGVPGIWACEKHRVLFKLDVDPELARLVKTIESGGWGEYNGGYNG